MAEPSNDPATVRSEFLQELAWRGLIQESTGLTELDELLMQGTVSAYIGFDCTAPSLHAGSLVPITLLRLLQRTGHRPIVLLGGGTSKVGDPSDKDEMRQLLTDERIEANKTGIRGVIEQFIEPGDGATGAIFADNAEWLDELGYITFLRDVGRHFTINRMLSFDSVRRRLDREQPMTFLEFNYMVLQAYDFVELARRHGCALQMGGSDQWGNIVNGVELSRRLLSRTVHGLTAPLLTTPSGAKMGKTADGAVWLDAPRVSPYDFWQYWRNVDDADARMYLRMFTDVPRDEVLRLEALQGAEANEAKKILATEMTRLCHGDAAAARAEDTARTTFEQGALGSDLPTIDVPRSDLEVGVGIVDLLRLTGLVKSGGEGRRLVDGGGARVNDVAVTDPKQGVTLADVTSEGVVKVSAGKKRHVLVRPA